MPNTLGFLRWLRSGKYLALDCEMVGVGIDGAESSLARVSLVNFYGAIQLDEFVRQRERVVDYRTQFSGIRELDMIKGMYVSATYTVNRSDALQTAKPFDAIQKQVAERLKDRILIGHAVHNDLKVCTPDLVFHTHTHVLSFLIQWTGTFVVSSASPNTRYTILRWEVQGCTE